MLTISRTRIPESCMLDLNFDKRPAHSLPASAVEEFPTPKTLQGPSAPRSFGSASATDSDPFPELLPWEALFEANIWTPPQSSGHKSVPSDISCDMLKTEQSVEPTVVDMARILDPTSLQYGFQEKYLQGLDATLLYSPLESFASACWGDVIDNRRDERQDSPGAGSLDDESSIDLEVAFSPKYSAREHIVPISASLLWSDDSDDDSDECRTDEDDYTPVPTIHANRSLVAAHPVGGFTTFEKEKGPFYRDLTASFGSFEPIFPSFTDPKESIGCSPMPIVHPTSPNKSVHKRIASFCARLPSRVSATIVR